MVFSLTFHIPRFFRPTLLEVFQITNTNLGDALAVYGIVAMLSYFPGGPLADKYSTRSLLAVSLIATALGGLYLAQIPDQFGLTVLYGYWGLTTIFLFWAALIKATREWGGTSAQGRAFGLLDAGRGLVAAVFASVATFFLSRLIPADIDIVSGADRLHALRTVIYLYSGATLIGAILVWLFIAVPPKDLPQKVQRKSLSISMQSAWDIIRKPLVWTQGVIVITAYCGYKSMDNYPLYAVEILGMTEVESAQFVTSAAYLRVAGAIIAGFLADRFSASKVIFTTFLVTAISFFILSLTDVDKSRLLFVYANVLITFFGVFALRGVYFALLEETKIASAKTGTAVGLISAVGFTPDVFFYAISARIMAASPGIEGYQNYFVFMALIVVAGMAATLILMRLNAHNKATR